MDNDKKRPALSPAQSLLHALIETIDHSTQSSTYLRETERLLDVLRCQLDWYEKALLAFQNAGEQHGNYDEFDALSEETLQTFQDPDTRLIENIKGLCEGTTDAIPYALAAYLNEEFQRLCDEHDLIQPEADDEKGASDEGLGDKDKAPADKGGVALCPFRQFNFFYEDIGRSFAGIFLSLTGRFRDLLEVLAPDEGRKLLQDLPKMPRTHALIGCQYAMADDVLYHSVLFHELGHYLFGFMHKDDYRQNLREKVLERLPTDHILKAYSRALQDSDIDEKRGFVSFQQTQLLALLLRWTNELFADAFATALGGPQYGLAFHNLAGPRQEHTTFTQLHPADLLRQRQQWLTLKQSGWATYQKVTEDGTTPDKDGAANKDEGAGFKEMAQQALSTLRHEEPSDEPDWRPEPHLVAEAIFPVLVSILDDIRTKIAGDAIACVSDTERRSSEFWQLGPDVWMMLENAVVPSTVVSKQRTLNGLEGMDAHDWLDPEEGAKGKAWVYHPRPCTVMNVVRLLYEGGCKKLLEEWPGEDDKEKLFLLHSRLSDWAQKAIADWLLFREKAR